MKTLAPEQIMTTICRFETQSMVEMSCSCISLDTIIVVVIYNSMCVRAAKSKHVCRTSIYYSKETQRNSDEV